MSFSSRPLPRPAQRTTASAPTPPARAPGPGACSPWIVTLQVLHGDGRRGTQSFAEWAPTSSQAITYAVQRAETPVARRRRRGAVVDPGVTAVAEFW